MGKKHYRLTTPKNPVHSLTEAGTEVTTQVVDEDELKNWLASWHQQAPEFHLEAAEICNYRVEVQNSDGDTATFTQDFGQLQLWLYNFRSMAPEHRSPTLRITRVLP